MPSTMVRVPEEAHAKLREMADQTGQSMQAVLTAAIEEYRRRMFWERVNVSFESLRTDQKAWAQEQDERAAWDATLGDGQEKE